MGDATSMCFEDEYFDVVLDKGTLDALAISNFDKFAAAGDSEVLVAAYLREVKRVLREKGSFLCISFGGPADRLKHFEAASIMQPIRHVELASGRPRRPFTRDMDTDHGYIYVKMP